MSSINIPHFNARTRIRPAKGKPGPQPSGGDHGSFTLDDDFDDLGVHAHPELKIAPGLIAHLGYAGGSIAPILERRTDAG